MDEPKSHLHNLLEHTDTTRDYITVSMEVVLSVCVFVWKPLKSMHLDIPIELGGTHDVLELWLEEAYPYPKIKD